MNETIRGIEIVALFRLLGANLQSTGDQAFTKLEAFNNYMVTKIIARLLTGGATITCAGGIYTGASKSGTALVLAAQSWINLSGAGKLVDASLAAVIGTDHQSATPNLALTTGSTAAATADFTIFGIPLD